MKRFCTVFLALLLLCASWIPAFAAQEDDLFDRSYTRFNDYAGTVTEDEEAQLNAKVRAKIGELRMDLPVCVFYTRQSQSTLSEFAADFYERNKFGCGDDKSGIILVLDTKNAVFNIFYYGEADTLIGESARQKLSDAFVTDCHNDDLSYYDVFDRYYDAVFLLVEDARLHPTTATEPQTRAEGEMPDWYPANTDGFTDFHGENLPPVVDDAHIFTSDQMRTLSEKIRSMTERLGIGYAAFTSNENYGLSPEEYSSDFLHFNGYGVGDGYGAVVFYLSLDPDDRCWLTTSINTYEALFTFDVTYEIDEMVDSSIRSGDYYEAFLMHADYVDKMFSAMSENLPEWYPDGTRTYDLVREGRVLKQKVCFDLPRIADSGGLLTFETEDSFEQALQTLSQQFGMDIVIFTDSVVRAPNASEYADDFYFYNAYGRDGICLYMFGNNDDMDFGLLYFGEGGQYANLGFEDELHGMIDDGKADKAIEKYVNLLTFLHAHGRLPMHISTAVFCLIFGLIAGLIVASVVLSSLKSKMKITQTVSAGSYLVDGSFRLLGNSHHYLYATISKRAKPKETDSSSSSGGSSRGGSSYSSGRSAGGSYSSGGRRF